MISIARSIIHMCALLLFCEVSAFATPITFVHTGFGAGTLAGVPFSRRAFTITGIGDTADRLTAGGGTVFYIDLIGASINIDGLGSSDFVTATRFFVNNNFDVVGFSRAGSGGLDLFDSSTNPVFDTWDMLSSIGPISGIGTLSQWLSAPVVTNQGVLSFVPGTSMSTFRATVGPVTTPEPMSGVLLGTGLVALGLVLRKGKESQIK